MVCQNKMKTVVIDNPVEQRELEPSSGNGPRPRARPWEPCLGRRWEPRLGRPWASSATSAAYSNVCRKLVRDVLNL